MKKFHSELYSANLMKLVLTGKHSIAKLEEMAIKIFSSVPNRNVTLPDLSKPVMPFDD